MNLLDSKIRSGEFKLILPYRTPLILGNARFAPFGQTVDRSLSG